MLRSGPRRPKEGCTYSLKIRAEKELQTRVLQLNSAVLPGKGVPGPRRLRLGGRGGGEKRGIYRASAWPSQPLSSCTALLQRCGSAGKGLPVGQSLKTGSASATLHVLARMQRDVGKVNVCLF